MALLIAGCASSPRSHKNLSVDDVVRSAGPLEGSAVVVKGYLRFGDDSRNLWESRTAYLTVSNHDVAPDDQAWTHCVTLWDIDGWRSALLEHNNRYVTISGVVRRQPLRDGEIRIGSCSDLGVSIRGLESPRG
jgi:hypothetical protein